MKPADLESERIGTLNRLGLLGSPPSESFDRITRMAGQIFALDASAISLTDTDRQWFISRLGVTDTELPRHKAPCGQVTDERAALVIPDLLANPHYADSALAQRGIRFYAGAPLTTRDGHCLGALCVVGPNPRLASDTEIAGLRDLAAMVMAQIELRHAFGRVDPVSGLPNRNQFIEDIDDLARDRPGEPWNAVMIDLAQNRELASIGRVMGPAHHDEIVRRAVHALADSLPASCKSYHVAATQLAFLPMERIGAQALGRIISRVAALRHDSEIRFATTPALGIAPFVLGKTNARDVLRTAYSATQDSRTNERAVSTYSPGNDAIYRRRFGILADFGAALQRPDELRLAYQPRVDLASGHCTGAEALLRWDHPELGELSPGEFIPLIEETSLVRDVTAWVLEHALRQQGVWRRQGLNLTLSINISVANLREEDLAARVQLLLRHNSLPAECIELELTESAIMDRSDVVRAQLAALDAAGVRMAIDDFGTGYSSLSYLHRLPVHVVKIDQSFIRHVQQDSRDHALVRSMIGLSHDLGYRVVAEGVETADAVNTLVAMECDEAQGFYFSRPIDPDALATWVQARNANGGDRLPETVVGDGIVLDMAPAVAVANSACRDLLRKAS